MKKDFDLCIYHGSCADGFGAASALYTKYKNDIEYHAGIHGHLPPYDLAKNKKVIIVDFSYKRDKLIELANCAESVLILNHHVSAEKDLVDLPENVEVIFDQSRSGAVITWDYIHGHVPKLIEHIGDRDIWAFKLKGTQEISAAIFSYEYDFDIWQELIFEGQPAYLEDEGKTLKRKQDKDIKEMIESSKHYLMFDGHKVPALNCSYFYASEAGNKMAQGNPFSVCYQFNGKKISCCLRSTDEGIDVSEIAVKFGGGGHRNASGCSFELSDFCKMIIENH